MRSVRRLRKLSAAAAAAKRAKDLREHLNLHVFWKLPDGRVVPVSKLRDEPAPESDARPGVGATMILEHDPDGAEAPAERLDWLDDRPAPAEPAPVTRKGQRPLPVEPKSISIAEASESGCRCGQCLTWDALRFMRPRPPVRRPSRTYFNVLAPAAW